MRNSLNPRSHMGCGGSKPPDATDASASDESFKDPTAAAEALENDAPPVSRNPGVTSASEVNQRLDHLPLSPWHFFLSPDADSQPCGVAF